MPVIRSICLAAAAGLLLLAAGCRSGGGGKLQGYIEGEYVDVGSPSSGELASLSVARGARVAKGDLLFTLDAEPERSIKEEAERRMAQAESKLEDLRKGARPSEMDALKAKLLASQAALRFAESDVVRKEKLVRSHSIAPEELDRAVAIRDQERARVAEAEAQVATGSLGAREDSVRAAEAEAKAGKAAFDAAAWRLAEKEQRASADALVFDTLFEPGEWIPAGRPVVTLLPPENVKVRTFVPEPRVQAFKAGQALRVSVDGVPDPLKATISYVSPHAEFTPPVLFNRENRAKLVFMVEAVFAPETARTLHPGQPVDVEIEPES